MPALVAVSISSALPMKGDKKDVTQFFLVFMRVIGLLGTKSGKRFYRRCPTGKPQLNPPQRGFRLIFQVGSPAFLRFPTFFPVVGSVEVSGRLNRKESSAATILLPHIQNILAAGCLFPKTVL